MRRAYYFGIKELEIISHGCWADPEIMFEESFFNYYDFDEFIYDLYDESDSCWIYGTFEDWAMANTERITLAAEEFKKELMSV